MSFHTDTNQHGMRAITVVETVLNPAFAPDVLTVLGNVGIPERSAVIAIHGPRGAFKGNITCSLEDLEQLGPAISALAAELKAAKP